MKETKVLICCEPEKKEQYVKKAESIYGDIIKPVMCMEEKPDRVFIIYPAEDKETVKEARQRRLPVFYLTEDFIPVDIYTMLLRDE